MGKRKQLMFTKSQFKKAIKDSRGVKLLIARRVGCDAHTLYSYLERYPELADLIQAEKQRQQDEMLDLATTKLRTHVLEGRPYAVALIINKLGRREGFIDRTELAAPNSDEPPFNLTVNISIDDSPTIDAED